MLFPPRLRMQEKHSKSAFFLLIVSLNSCRVAYNPRGIKHVRFYVTMPFDNGRLVNSNSNLFE
jgi:hypothetical protein